MDSRPFHAASRRPRDSSFQQQRFRVWQSFMNINTAIPLFGVFGFVFLIISMIIVFVNQNVSEIRVDYTQCKDTVTTVSTDASMKSPIKCSVRVEIPENLKPPVFFYYIVTGAYQNFRIFSNSIDYSQFFGNPTLSPSENCAPLITDPVTGKPYLPCGLLANSFFNDTFILKNGSMVIPWSYENLILPSEKILFKNPVWSLIKDKFVQPPDWPTDIENFGDDDAKKGFENYDLIQWIRVSPFPDAIKLYRRIDGELLKNNYTVEIQYNYQVDPKVSRKLFMIATVGYLGLRSNFLAYIYITVGLICLVSCLFLCTHRFCRRNTAQGIS